MFGFGKPRPAVQDAPLGTALVALRVHGDVRLPPGCVELVFSAAGQARRALHSRAGTGEIAVAYHPGPYETVFAPFAGAPEIGLRLRYLADAADPRVAQQRFDLFLFSEGGEALTVEALHQAAATAVRDALAQGALELPACTTLDEWHGFRAGLNELLYTRFGLTVDDCVPVELGDVCDYAELLRARAARAAGAAGVAIRVPGSGPGPVSAIDTADVASGGPAPARVEDAAGAATLAPARGGEQDDHAAGIRAAAPHPAPWSADANTALPLPCDAADADAHALRRLFLELPAWSAGVRLLALPSGTAAARRDVLQRCAMAALDVNTMPALAWAAPNRPLAAASQARRAAHGVAAAQALDQAWALLARWRLATRGVATVSTEGAAAQAASTTQGSATGTREGAAMRTASSTQGGATAATECAAVHAALLDEADRLMANLAFHLAARRAIAEEPAPMASRKEPHL